MRKNQKLVVTCLWQGHDLPGYSANKYGVDDVLTLWRGVRRHVTDGALLVLCDQHHFDLLTDADRMFLRMREGETSFDVASTCMVRKMHGYGIGGWSPVMEAFRQDLGLFDYYGHRNVLLVGLDTVFTGNADWLFDLIPENDGGPGIYLPPDPHSPANPPCDAVVLFNEKGREFAWTEYVRAKAQPEFPHRYPDANGWPSEMVLLQHLWRAGECKLIEETPKRLLSYKAHIRAKHVQAMPEDCSIIYFHGSPKLYDLAADDFVRVHALQ